MVYQFAMLNGVQRQSDIDFPPSELLTAHFELSAESGYWDEVERDLQENPDIWSRPDPAEMFG